MTASDLRHRLKDDRISIAVCFLISLLAWLVIKLSQEYNHNIRFNVSYRLPAAQAFDRLPPSTLNAQLRAKGWTFLSMSLDKGRDTIEIPIIASGALPLIPIIQERLPVDLSERINILSITPMQLDIRLEEKVSKKVPISLPPDLTTAPQHQFSQPIVLQPDSVTLYGTARLLAPMTSWATEPFGGAPLKESFEGEIELVRSSNSLITKDVNSCVVRVAVEEITEKQIYVPITLGDSHKDSIQIFPDQALVKCTVGLSSYDQVKRDAFILRAAPDPSLQKSEWKVEITKMPDFVTLIDYSPKTVEYFLINP
jgi:hypothetical protein